MGSYRLQHAEAWGYLLDKLQPDVALLQETLLTPPSLASGRGRLIARGAFHGTKNWGSGVFLASPGVQELLTDCEGVHIAAARGEMPGGAVNFVNLSVHAPARKSQLDALRKLVGAVTKLAREGRLVVGGDFNAARLWDDAKHKTAYRPFFEAMAAAAFYDCTWRKNGREQQSFWRDEGALPLQDDHIFVNETWGAKVSQCSVIDNAEVRRLSDHGPVLLVVDE